MPTKITRGVRNNNPGNIDRNATKWQGMAVDQSGDSRFIVFMSPQYGIRALARTLMTYQSKHGLKTVKGIINRWAPPVENDTDAYVNAVAKKVGVRPTEVIDVDDIAIMRPLVEAIIAHENAGYVYPAGVVEEGLHLAAVSGAKKKPLAKQTTFIAQAATTVASCGAAVATVSEPVKKAADGLAPFAGSPLIERIQIALITLAGLAALVGILSALLKQRATA